MGRKVVIAMLFLFLSTFLHAKSVADACFSFFTSGPDRYADGSVVLDGECYALVWSKDGNFDGFSASGECVDENDRIVLIAPIAKDGHLPRVLFQIPAQEADELAGGKYAVYLLDTRLNENGQVRPKGMVNGKIVLMNGYGATTANISFGGSTSFKTANEKNSTQDEGQVADSLCAAPAGCDQPRIKSISIEGDNVFLTVENLKGFMRVSSGSDVSASSAATAAVETSGEGGEVTLVTRKPGDSGFFKVIRNGN